MAKQGIGYKWVFTDKRKATAIEHFKSQGSLTSLAIQFGIDKSTLSRAIKQHNIPYKELQASGLQQLRRRTFKLIESLDEDKQFDAGMKFLSRYEQTVDEVEEDTIIDTDAIRTEILADLNVPA